MAQNQDCSKIVSVKYVQRIEGICGKNPEIISMPWLVEH